MSRLFPSRASWSPKRHLICFFFFCMSFVLNSAIWNRACGWKGRPDHWLHLCQIGICVCKTPCSLSSARSPPRVILLSTAPLLLEISPAFGLRVFMANLFSLCLTWRCPLVSATPNACPVPPDTWDQSPGLFLSGLLFPRMCLFHSQVKLMAHSSWWINWETRELFLSSLFLTDELPECPVHYGIQFHFWHPALRDLCGSSWTML